MQKQIHDFDLSAFELSAGIDFVTLTTPGKVNLPRLDGTPKWVVTNHFRTLTVHDAKPADFAALIRAFPNAIVTETEIRVDLTPKPGLAAVKRRELLEQAHRWMAATLYPFAAPMMAGMPATAYCHWIGKPRPFAHRAVKPHEQLLYGWKHSQAQVKVYLKEVDQGQALPSKDCCLRVEVAFRGEGCHEIGLGKLQNFFGFRFRSVLSPFFRLVRGAIAPSPKRTRLQLYRLVRKKLAQIQQEAIDSGWERTGIQGALIRDAARFPRLSKANQRIGKALQHLEYRFACSKLVLTSIRASAEDGSALRVSEPSAPWPVTINQLLTSEEVTS